MQRLLRCTLAIALLIQTTSVGPLAPARVVLPSENLASFSHCAINAPLLFTGSRPKSHAGYQVRTVVGLLLIAGSAHLNAASAVVSPHAVSVTTHKRPAKLADLLEDARHKKQQYVDAVAAYRESFPALEQALKQVSTTFRAAVRIDDDLIRRDVPQTAVAQQIADVLSLWAVFDPKGQGNPNMSWIALANAPRSTYLDRQSAVAAALAALRSAQQLLPKSQAKVGADIDATVAKSTNELDTELKTIFKGPLSPQPAPPFIWHSYYFFIRSSVLPDGRIQLEQIEARNLPVDLANRDGANIAQLKMTTKIYDLQQPHGEMEVQPDWRNLPTVYPSLTDLRNRFEKPGYLEQLIHETYDAAPSAATSAAAPITSPAPVATPMPATPSLSPADNSMVTILQGRMEQLLNPSGEALAPRVHREVHQQAQHLADTWLKNNPGESAHWMERIKALQMADLTARFSALQEDPQGRTKFLLAAEALRAALETNEISSPTSTGESKAAPAARVDTPPSPLPTTTEKAAPAADPADPHLLALIEKSSAGKLILSDANWDAPELARQLTALYGTTRPEALEIQAHLQLTNYITNGLEKMLQSDTTLNSADANREALSVAYTLQRQFPADAFGLVDVTRSVASTTSSLAERYKTASKNASGADQRLKIAGDMIHQAISDAMPKPKAANNISKQSLSLFSLIALFWGMPWPSKRRWRESRSDTATARREARYLIGKDFLRYAQPTTIREFIAYATLMDYPVAPLLADLDRFARGTDDYNETVMALKINHNLVTYAKIRDRYTEFQIKGETKKAEDVRDILRMVRYNTVLFGKKGDGKWDMINSRTWPHRADESIPRIASAVIDYAKTHHRRIGFETARFLIQDWAVSDGVSSLELAQFLNDRNLRFSIEAYDNVLSIYVVNEKNRSWVFSSDGTLLQSYDPHSDELHLRWTLANYLPKPWRQVVLRVIRWYGHVQASESNESWMKSQTTLLAKTNHATDVPLLDPEAKAFAEMHPTLLTFKQEDIARPPAPLNSTQMIRVWGLLNRDADRYFYDGTIMDYLSTLGRSLSAGGQLVNGILGTKADAAHLFIDVYQREPAVLKMIHSSGYTTTAGWEFISLRRGAFLPQPTIKHPPFLRSGIPTHQSFALRAA